MKKIKIISSFLKFTYKAYKPYYFLTAVKCLVSSALTVFNAYSISFLIKYFEKGVYKEALISAGIIVGINFVFYFLNKLLLRLDEVSERKMREAVDVKLGRKTYESSVFLFGRPVLSRS